MQGYSPINGIDNLSFRYKSSQNVTKGHNIAL